MTPRCRFCPEEIDQDDPTVRWFDIPSLLFQIAHKECAFFCRCGRVIASHECVTVNPYTTVCGHCARELVDLALDRGELRTS